MPDTLNFESEQFLILLTDALRSGPGSPEWHQAVLALRDPKTAAQNGAASPAPAAMDEYTLLCTAREHLESGKSYRSLRAGAGFTRKVMDGVDQADKGTGRGPLLSTNLIAFLAVGVILAVVIAVAAIVSRSVRHPAGDDLANTYFATDAIPLAQFNGSQPSTGPQNLPNHQPPMPAGWRAFGELPLVIIKGGLQPAPEPAIHAATNSTNPAREFATSLAASQTTGAAIEQGRTGGIVCATPLAATPVEINLVFKLMRPSDDIVAQAFVTDEPVTGESVGPREIVCQIAAAEANVFLSGHAEPDSQRLAVGRTAAIRILVDRDNVVVEADGHRIYSGPHQLNGQQPRYVGVRFFRRQDKPDRPQRSDNIALLSIGVKAP